MSPKARGRIWKLALLVGSTIASILIVDICLQKTLPIPQFEDSEWAGPPRMSMFFESSPDNFATTHAYNSLGFRGEEIPRESPSVNRVLCIGDSWTEGIGAHVDQSWPAILDRELSDYEYEIINLGDAGAAPDRYLEILLQVGVALKPTHCIMCLIPSDLQGGPKLPALQTARTSIRDTFRERDGAFASFAARYVPGWTFLIDRSMGKWHQRDGIYWANYEIPKENLAQLIAVTDGITLEQALQLLDERIPHLDPICVEAARNRGYNGFRIDLELVQPQASYKCSTSDMGISEEELREKTDDWFELFNQTCKKHQIEPIACYFPEAGLISRDPVGPMVASYYDDAPDVTTDCSVSNLLNELCQRHGIRYYDSTPLLRQHSDEPYF